VIDLNNVFFELFARTLLVIQIMGDEGLKKGFEDMEKLKIELVESSSSLNVALSANITLMGNNKGLESENAFKRSRLRH